MCFCKNFAVWLQIKWTISHFPLKFFVLVYKCHAPLWYWDRIVFSLFLKKKKMTFHHPRNSSIPAGVILIDPLVSSACQFLMSLGYRSYCERWVLMTNYLFLQNLNFIPMSGFSKKNAFKWEHTSLVLVWWR